MSERILSFREMQAYQLAVDLQGQVFEITKRFPKEDTYSLTDQFRRSSRSIGANIAEAWHKRRYPAHFVSKLTDADGEQAETQHWINTSLACQYVNQTLHDEMLQKCFEIGRKLGAIMASPEKWCP